MGSLVGLALGLWNGFLVAVLKIQPIIATLVLMLNKGMKWGYVAENAAQRAAKLKVGRFETMETRSENFLATNHGRDQWADVEIAADADGNPISFSVTGLPSFATFQANSDGTGTISLAPTLAHAAGDTVGYSVGAYGYGDAPGDAGKFTLTLHRGLDERWLIFSDMDNANRPPYPAGAPPPP